MTRINAIRSTEKNNLVAWGKKNLTKDNAAALLFAALLVACAVTVGCSSDKPKPVSSGTQLPVAQTPVPAPSTMLAESKPEPKPAKKIVPKKPATVNYTDKTYGVTFEYPRRYAIETGSAATDLLESSPVPMNFVQTGGVALAAVELPESIYANTDFSSAFFNVSVHKGLTADQCGEFAVPQPKVVAAKLSMEEKPADTKMPESKPAESSSTQAPATEATSNVAPETCHPEDGTKCGPKDLTTASASTSAEKTTTAASTASNVAPEPQGSKLLLGDLELRGTEAVSGEGTRQSDSKYFHVYQNGACYEFAMNVTTVASEEGISKHVDRDKVFTRLEQILSTVKINPVTPQEVTAEAPAQTAATPAQ